jgi:hypothetical protein
MVAWRKANAFLKMYLRCSKKYRVHEVDMISARQKEGVSALIGHNPIVYTYSWAVNKRINARWCQCRLMGNSAKDTQVRTHEARV